MAIKKNELRAIFTGDATSFHRAAKGVLRGAIGTSKAVAIAGAAAGAALAIGMKGTRAAAAFSLEMAEVATLTKLSAAEQKDLESGVRNLSKEFGAARTELTGGLYQALSAGVPKSNAIEFLRVASIAAQAGVTDVKTAVDGISTVINAFGLEAADAESVADSLFTTVRLGKTTFEELSSNIGKVAPIAAAAGVSFDEMNAFLAEMTSRGLSTEEATTALKGTLNALIKPAGELAGKLSDVKQDGLASVLGTLVDSADGGVEAIAKMFPNIVGLLGVLSAGVGSGGTINDTLDEFVNKAGAATKASAIIAAAFGTDFKKIKAEFDDALLGLGEDLQPQVRAISKDVIGLFSNQEFKDGVANLAEVLGLTLKVAALVPKAVGAGGEVAKKAEDGFIPKFWTQPIDGIPKFRDFLPGSGRQDEINLTPPQHGDFFQMRQDRLFNVVAEMEKNINKRLPAANAAVAQ